MRLSGSYVRLLRGIVSACCVRLNRLVAGTLRDGIVLSTVEVILRHAFPPGVCPPVAREDPRVFA